MMLFSSETTMEGQDQRSSISAIETLLLDRAKGVLQLDTQDHKGGGLIGSAMHAKEFTRYKTTQSWGMCVSLLNDVMHDVLSLLDTHAR